MYIYTVIWKYTQFDKKCRKKYWYKEWYQTFICEIVFMYI